MELQPDREAIEKAQQTLYNEGMKMREQVLGTAHVKASRELPALQQPIQSLAVSAGWSLCWTRPGLERKTRSLITISLLTALSQDHELGVHVKVPSAMVALQKRLWRQYIRCLQEPFDRCV